MSYTREKCEKRFNSLKQEHNKWIKAYKDLKDYINPFRGIFHNDRSKTGDMIDHKRLISSYATHALRIFASGLQSGMTSKSSNWFKLTIENEDILEQPGVKQWLSTVEGDMYSIIAKSNLYDVFYSTYEELGQFGTGCFLVLEDYDDVIRARSFTAGEYFIATDNKGRANTFAREFEMTVEQVVMEFGLESCSPQVRALYENAVQRDSKIKICHIIKQNDYRKLNSDDMQDMKYESVYWEAGTPKDMILARRGYKMFRVVCPRWETISTDSTYGYGPGWHAIGSIKELQKTRKDKIIAQEKLHTPPMQKDATVTGHVSHLPGGMTVSNGTTPNVGVRPAYQINPNLDSFIELIGEEKEEIDRFFYVNLFLMMMNIDRKNMTATEITERQQEKIMMMSQALHKCDEEMLTPTLENVYDIMLENGLIPEPPEAISGMEIKIEFTSMLAQAQKASGITKIERVLGVASAAAPVMPSILDNIDEDEAIRAIANMEGADPKVIRDRIRVDELRQARQAQAAQQMALESAKTGSEAIKNASTAPVGQGSVMDLIAANQGQ